MHENMYLIRSRAFHTDTPHEIVNLIRTFPLQQTPHLRTPDNGHLLDVQRFRGGLVFQAHRLLYHSILASRVIKRRKEIFWTPCWIQSVSNARFLLDTNPREKRPQYSSPPESSTPDENVYLMHVKNVHSMHFTPPEENERLIRNKK